ncbi:MAG: response regulator transcription factor [Cyanobacteria bacterium]|nr:response regulator transcription factor [Cyanobacteriota bacterium]
MAKILLVEDDPELADMVCKWLAREGYVVEHTMSGTVGLEKLSGGSFDLAILDWELPGLSGPEICMKSRESGDSIPLLILTARHAVDDAEFGLSNGADDYLRKPFSVRELSARIRALLRRASQEYVGVELKARDLTLLAEEKKVLKGELEIELTLTEYTLLEFFLRNPERAFSTQELLDHVWSSSSDSAFSALTSCIKRLRKKIDSPGSSSLIKSVYGTGYRLDP